MPQLQALEIALLSVLFKRIKNFGSILQVVCNMEFTRPNSRHKPAFFFSIFYLSYHFNSSFDAQDFLFIHDRCHGITLPVSCQLHEKKRTRKLNAQSELPFLLSFPGLEYM